MSHKNMVITGASGFTGQHAVRYFKEKGYHVLGISRRFENDEMIQADLTKRDNVFRIIKNKQPDFVLHLAGQNAVETSWKRPLDTIDANVVATLNILEVIRKHQSKAKIIIIGSALEERLEESRLPSHPYGLSKALQTYVARKWAELFGMQVVIAKPTNLIGPGFSQGVCAQFAEKIADMEKRGEPGTLTIANPEIRREFLDVRDAVRGYDILFQKGKTGEIYELGTGHSVSLVQIVEFVQEMTDMAFKVNMLNQPVQLTVPSLNTKKMLELGWKPMISLKQSLLDCLNFYRQQN